ncbi:MAG: DUF362 domain-containing protein [Muribaculaceae bacterium]|nr:DUF362 domain-containing protein [Muribaculaceae bacterium]
MKRFKSIFAAGALATVLAATACSSKAAQTDNVAETAADSVPTVYYIKDITPQNIIKVYEALGRKAEGKNIGIKISTGESNKSNHLDTALIADFVRLVNGTFIECNTAYAGNRNTTEAHLQAAKEHGFTDLAGVDILDAEGEIELRVEGGKHLKKDIVGKNIKNYDFMIVLSHFKGHQMGGFGGALKNISIGLASSAGKTYIHTAGKTANVDSVWRVKTEQADFIESMADAAKAITDYSGDHILYINVANRLSVDCDCNGNPAAPEMGDLGVFASLDPVALDQACVDMVFNSNDPGKDALIERINSRQGTLILEHGEKLGIGSRKYRLVTIEE